VDLVVLARYMQVPTHSPTLPYLLYPPAAASRAAGAAPPPAHRGGPSDCRRAPAMQQGLAALRTGWRAGSSLRDRALIGRARVRGLTRAAQARALTQTLTPAPQRRCSRPSSASGMRRTPSTSTTPSCRPSKARWVG